MGVVVISFISLLPETLISVQSAFEGSPSLGLGTLIGSNVADLTLIIALVCMTSKESIKINRQILSTAPTYILSMFIPIIAGIDGNFSRLEGVFLILTGIYFYYNMLNKKSEKSMEVKRYFSLKDFSMLLISMACLLIGSNFVVEYGINIAQDFNVDPVFIGLLIIGLSTTIPELFFGIQAVKKNHYSLAMGDILGTVIADATIVMGLMITIAPFSFNPQIIYTSGIFMLLSTFILFRFMKKEQDITKKEALLLILIYILFVSTEFILNS